mgnify:CR=1 FL=1
MIMIGTWIRFTRYHFTIENLWSRIVRLEMIMSYNNLHPPEWDIDYLEEQRQRYYQSDNVVYINYDEEQ